MAYKKKEISTDVDTNFQPPIKSASINTQDLNKKFLYSEFLFFAITCGFFFISLFHAVDPLKVKKLTFVTWGSFLFAKFSLLKKEKLIVLFSKMNLYIKEWEEKEVQKIVHLEKEKK